jgi:hypothetical protein
MMTLYDLTVLILPGVYNPRMYQALHVNSTV